MLESVDAPYPVQTAQKIEEKPAIEKVEEESH
jgi:hypothetical protein